MSAALRAYAPSSFADPLIVVGNPIDSFIVFLPARDITPAPTVRRAAT